MICCALAEADVPPSSVPYLPSSSRTRTASRTSLMSMITSRVEAARAVRSKGYTDRDTRQTALLMVTISARRGSETDEVNNDNIHIHTARAHRTWHAGDDEPYYVTLSSLAQSLGAERVINVARHVTDACDYVSLLHTPSLLLLLLLYNTRCAWLDFPHTHTE